MLGNETEKEETEKEEVDEPREVNDLFSEEMSAKDLLDSLVNLLQVMGSKLVEKDAEIQTLQADREYLRDENIRWKNRWKLQKHENIISSGRTIISVTVRFLMFLIVSLDNLKLGRLQNNQKELVV